MQLRDLLALATPDRSGDHLANIAANTARERATAQTTLADIPLKQFPQRPDHPL